MMNNSFTILYESHIIPILLPVLMTAAATGSLGPSKIFCILQQAFGSMQNPLYIALWSLVLCKIHCIKHCLQWQWWFYAKSIVYLLQWLLVLCKIHCIFFICNGNQFYAKSIFIAMAIGFIQKKSAIKGGQNHCFCQ